MLIVMDKSTHEERLSQPLQTNIKQFKIAVTFLIVYNGTLNVTNSNIKFHFKKTIGNKDASIQITIKPGAYEIDCMNNETKRITIDEEYYNESDYPFQIKPIFPTPGSAREISPQRLIINFVFDDSIGNLLRFNETILYKEYNLSPNPVDILPFDNIFLECDFATRMICEQKRSRIFNNWTMTVNPGYKYVESFTGGITWYMMENKDVTSSFSFKLKNENIKLVSFNGQSVSFK